jgi:glycosyltransferase involved in cell wall biosynthesis
MYRWAVIPAYNEAVALGQVVQQCRANGFKVLVIDDGSEDATASLVDEREVDIVIRHDRNRGYESALRTGLQAVAEFDDCQWAVSLDADGQLDPEDASRLIDLAEREGVPMALGVRSRVVRYAERLAGFIQRRLTGIKDPFCGMKAYRRDLLRSESRRAGCGIGAALAIAAVKKGYGWVQHEITLSPRRDGRSRFAHSWFAELKMFMTIIVASVRVKDDCL